MLKEGLAGRSVWWRAMEVPPCLLPRREVDRQRMSQQTMHKENLISVVVGWPVDQCISDGCFVWPGRSVAV